MNFEETALPHTLGERLSMYRRRSNLSQKQLAELVGVSAATICNYERDKTTPNLDRTYLLAQAVGVTMNLILYGYEPKREYGPVITD